MTTEEIDTLYEKLYPLTQIDAAQKLTHIENIQRKQQAAATDRKEKRCLRCGGTLVVRTATRGEQKGERFLGCFNYPKCKYVGKIS